MDESELIRQAKAGYNLAKGILIERFEGLAYKSLPLAIRYDKDERQEALISVLEAISTYDESQGVKLSTHIVSVVKFRLVDRYRARAGRNGQKVIKTVSLDEELAKDPDNSTLYDILSTDKADPRMYAEQVELDELINMVLDTMSPINAKVLRLRYIEDYTFRKIGEVLGITGAGAGQIGKKALKEAKRLATNERLSELIRKKRLGIES